MMKKRLLRFAGADEIKQSLTGVSKDGRDILKQLENFKFTLEQSGRIASNYPDVTNKISQNAKIIDKLMSNLYSVCFDLENLEIIPMYDPFQIDMSTDTTPDSKKKNFDVDKENPQNDSKDNDVNKPTPPPKDTNQEGSGESEDTSKDKDNGASEKPDETTNNEEDNDNSTKGE